MFYLLFYVNIANTGDDFMKNIYLHAINPNQSEFDIKTTNIILSKILKSRYLLSRRLQNNYLPVGFNGLDYISLCDYDKKDIYNSGSIKYSDYNAYHNFIASSLSLMFPKECINAIDTKTIDYIYNYQKSYDYMQHLGLSSTTRYSDLPDEVQVKDKISLDHLIALTIPMHLIYNPLYSKDRNYKRLIKELSTIKSILIRYHYLGIPIYDITR